MRIYVASSWRNVWQPAVVSLLRFGGHEVYDFREPASAFNWRSIDPDWQQWTAERYRQALTHPLAEAGFKRDMGALRTADACVLVQPCGMSAHLELGWAIGAGKHTAVLYPLDVDPGNALGHSMSMAECAACNDEWCFMPDKLKHVEPELMAKAADAILLSATELRDWLDTFDPRKLSVNRLEISIRLANFLGEMRCQTIGDAEALLSKPVWSKKKKSERELRDILKAVL